MKRRKQRGEGTSRSGGDGDRDALQGQEVQRASLDRSPRHSIRGWGRWVDLFSPEKHGVLRGGTRL